MEDIELLKKQYEAVKKQRDDLHYFLADLIDTIGSGAYNRFDLRNDDRIVDKEGNRVSMFDGLDKYLEGLHRGGYYHLARLLEKVKEYNISMDKQPHKAELAILLETWKLPEKIEKWKNYHRLDESSNELSDDTRKEMLHRLATSLMIFAHEYDFSANYPGADRGVYSEAFSELVGTAMQLAGIPTTHEGIEEAMKDAYRSPSKRI